MVKNRGEISGKRRESGQNAGDMIFQAYRGFLLLAGVSGILLLLRSVPAVSFSEALVFPGTAFFCLILWVLFVFRRKWFRAAALISVLAAAALLAGTEVREQGRTLLAGLTDSAVQGETDITIIVCLAAVLISVAFFLLETEWNGHWILCAAVTACLVSAPLFGVRPGIGAVLLCLIFEVMIWVVGNRTAERKREDGRTANEGTKSARVRAGVFTGAALSVLICISVIITSLWGTELAGGVYSAEGFVYRSLQRITGRAQEPASNGTVSRGNNYRTGETQITVTLLDEPGETLYLQGFSGGEYTGGEWEAADDNRIFHIMAQKMMWQEWESWISGLYHNLYFVMTELTAENPPEPRAAYLQYDRGSDHVIYSPYYSGWLNRQDRSRAGYGFRYYEQDEIEINWGQAPETLEMTEEWYREVQDGYMEEIGDIYTAVPEELLPRLTELCRSHPMETLDEVSAFILAVLEEYASYTLTPGRAPVNEDIVEYFLFDNHEGYCVHFASAATLMYRLYGIPARYVSGYAVDPSDFERQEDGTWVAGVTDESAHAWTEIFLEDYGWVPVEVTPASDGSIGMSYPGLDTGMLEEMTSGISLNLESGASSGEDGDDADTERADAARRGNAETDGFGTLSIDFSAYREVLLVLGAVLAETVLLIPLFLDYRRLRKLRQMERMSCREIFGRYIKMLHFAGYMTGLYGAEESFAERLSKEVHCVGQEEAGRLVRIVSRAAYGRGEPEKKDMRFVREIYFRIAEEIKGTLNRGRRLRFRYLKAFY